MELKTIEQKKEFLRRNLGAINTVVTAYIGARVNLQIVERKTMRETYLDLVDHHNFVHCCGIMSRAFEEVIVDTFNIWWGDDGCELVMNFSYEHIDGGHNRAEFCRINVEDDFVTIK